MVDAAALVACERIQVANSPDSNLELEPVMYRSVRLLANSELTRRSHSETSWISSSKT